MNTEIKCKTIYIKMSSKYQMVTFHHTAGYIETASGYLKAYKNKKISSAPHTAHIQFLHNLCTFRKLIYGIQNRIWQICFVHINLALLSLSASLSYQILIRVVKKWRQNCGWWSCLSLNLSFSQFNGELKRKISSRDSISSFLLAQQIGVDTSKAQDIVKDSCRPPPYTCLHRVLSCHLVSNTHTTFSFVVEYNCLRFLFCCCVDHNRWVECAKNVNVLLLFALVNCQGCGLVIFIFWLQGFAGISGIL